MPLNINRFHLTALFTWQFCSFFAVQQIFAVFANYVPKWRCSSNQSFSSSCEVFLDCDGHVEYEEMPFFSAAIEFQWVCGPSVYLASLFSQVQFFGVLIGTFVFGTLADAFGRRPVSLIILALGIVATFSSGLVPTWQVFFVLRFFVGLSIGGTIVVIYTFIMELLLPEQRMILRGFFNWGHSRLLLTLICFVLPNWRSSTIASSLSFLPALLSVMFILPESPIWLHSKGQMEDMRRSERKMFRVAGVEYMELEHKTFDKQQGLLEVIRNFTYAKTLMVLCMMWFTASLTSYVTDLNSTRISGNLYVNQALFSVLLIISKVVLALCDAYSASFNRRQLHQTAQFIASLSFFAVGVLLIFQYQGIALLVLSLFGTTFNEYTWDACYLCAVEAMPTQMRGTSIGMCSLCARIGAILSPVLYFLATLWTPSPYMTVVLFGLTNLVISRMFLIDTKGVTLDTVDAEWKKEEKLGLEEMPHK